MLPNFNSLKDIYIYKERASVVYQITVNLNVLIKSYPINAVKEWTFKMSEMVFFQKILSLRFVLAQIKNK